MKNKPVLFLVVALLSLSLSVAIVSAQEQAPAPSFKEGDTWQFNINRKSSASSTEHNNGTYELIFTQGSVKLFQVSGNQKTPIEIRPDGPTQELLLLVGKSAQQPDLKFPLSVGLKWSYDYETKVPGGRREVRRSVEITTFSTEQVTTSAGAFKAYKLVRNESWIAGEGRGQRSSSSATAFYSPETKSIVKRVNASESGPESFTEDTELIKFTPGS